MKKYTAIYFEEIKDGSNEVLVRTITVGNTFRETQKLALTDLIPGWRLTFDELLEDAFPIIDGNNIYDLTNDQILELEDEAEDIITPQGLNYDYIMFNRFGEDNWFFGYNTLFEFYINGNDNECDYQASVVILEGEYYFGEEGTVFHYDPNKTDFVDFTYDDLVNIFRHGNNQKIA